MKKKRLLAVITAMVMITVIFTGCGGGGGEEASGDKYKFVIGHSMADDTSFGYAVNEKLKAALDETGYFETEVYGASALGSESECIQAVQSGDIQLYMTIAATYSAFIPAVYVFDHQMPWIGNADEGVEVLQSIYNDKEFSDYIKAQCEGSGLKVVGFSTLTYRTFTTNDEVASMDDWKGMDLRVNENPIHIKSINSWGANATPLSFTEVYASLQQGLIQGQSNPPEPTYSSKLYEPQDYITNANHCWHVVVWTVSEDSWNSYSPEAQEALQTAIDQACLDMTDYCLEHNDEYLKLFAEKGCQPIALPYDTLAEMQKRSAAANELIPEYSGEEAYDLFLQTMDKAIKDSGYDQSKEAYELYIDSKSDVYKKMW